MHRAVRSTMNESYNQTVSRQESTITNHQGLQSSIPKARVRLKLVKGQVNLIIIQCLARRQPRQRSNIFQWVGRFVMFQIIWMANKIMVWRFHYGRNLDLYLHYNKHVVMLAFKHKNISMQTINYIISRIILVWCYNISTIL